LSHLGQAELEEDPYPKKRNEGAGSVSKQAGASRMQGRANRGIDAVFSIRTGQHDAKDDDKGKCVEEEESSEEGGESRKEEEQEQETTGTMLPLSGGLAEKERVREEVYIPMLTAATQYEHELQSDVTVIKLAKKSVKEEQEGSQRMLHIKNEQVVSLAAYIHAYIHTHIHTYMHTHIHTYIHTCILGDMRTYMHTYMHAYIHTYIHTSSRVSRTQGLHQPGGPAPQDAAGNIAGSLGASVQDAGMLEHAPLARLQQRRRPSLSARISATLAGADDRMSSRGKCSLLQNINLKDLSKGTKRWIHSPHLQARDWTGRFHPLLENVFQEAVVQKAGHVLALVLHVVALIM
jgi:hypothetical protein